METIRDLPTGQPNNTTHEYIHESALNHPACLPSIKKLVEKYPDIVCKLSAHENMIKDKWPYDKTTRQATAYEGNLSKTQNLNESWATSTFNSLKKGFWTAAPVAAVSGFTLLVANQIYS